MIEILPNWHPIFVHFTVALFVIAALLHLGSHFVSEDLSKQWAIVSRWNLWLGLGFTVLTLAAGVYAYNTVDHDTPSHAAMTIHRNWAIVTSLVFFAAGAWSVVLNRQGQTRSWAFTAVLIAAAGLLGTTAWHGGEIVYRHGLGVKALPQVEGAGHSHSHDDGSAHDNSSGAAAPHEHADAAHAHDDSMSATPSGATVDDHHHEPGAAPHTH